MLEFSESAGRWVDGQYGLRPVFEYERGIPHALDSLVADDWSSFAQDRDPIEELRSALAEGPAGSRSLAGSRTTPRSSPDSFLASGPMRDRPDTSKRLRLPEQVSPERVDFVHFVAFLSPHLPLDGAASLDGEGLASARRDWEDLGEQERAAALARLQELSLWRRELVSPLTATGYRRSVSVRRGNGIIVTWFFEAGALTMALNPNPLPIDMECFVNGMPVVTGQWCTHGEVLRLGGWSALAWSTH